jgi:saccharopine dehydrogenase-like NADP-dependent oxidoreductase
MILTMNFFGCSMESNNQQKDKIETIQQKTSDSNKTDTINSDSKKTKIEIVESNASVVNVKPKPEPTLIYKKVIPNKKPVITFAEQKKSKNDLQPESNMIDSLNSKLAETNRSKIKTESQKEEKEIMFTESNTKSCS